MRRTLFAVLAAIVAVMIVAPAGAQKSSMPGDESRDGGLPPAGASTTITRAEVQQWIADAKSDALRQARRGYARQHPMETDPVWQRFERLHRADAMEMNWGLHTQNKVEHAAFAGVLKTHGDAIGDLQNRVKVLEAPKPAPAPPAEAPKADDNVNPFVVIFAVAAVFAIIAGLIGLAMRLAR